MPIEQNAAAGRDTAGEKSFCCGAWGPALLLAIVTLAVFSPVIFGGGFFWTDDYDLLVNNPLVKSAGGLWGIWCTHENPDYFPLMSTSFWLEWRVWGPWAPGYHLTNVLLHIASSLLLWRIFRRLGIGGGGAFAAALLFAIHPVNVESVAWIAERKNTLSMLLACASLLMYLRAQKEGGRRSYAAAVAFFALALLAKTAPVMLPVVLLILAWRKTGRIGWNDLRRTAPFFALSLVMGLVTIWFQYGRAIGDTMVRGDSLASRAAVAGAAVWFYLGKAIFPVGITFNYPRWDVMSWGMWTFVPLIFLVAVFAALWIYRRTAAGQILAALAAYVAMLLPVLGFLNIFFMRYSLVSDHWQYMALPCVLAPVGAAAAWAYQRAKPQWRRWLVAGGIVVVAVLAIDSTTIAAVYRSSETVWLDTLAHNPDSFLAHDQLGEIYFNRARGDPAHFAPLMEMAARELRRGAELRPDMSATWTNLGNALAAMGQNDEALAAYQRALAAPDTNAGDQAYLHLNIGSLLARRGDLADAEPHFREAIHLNHNLAPAYRNLDALIRTRRGVQQGTVRVLEEILQSDPGNAAARNLLDMINANVPTTTRGR